MPAVDSPLGDCRQPPPTCHIYTLHCQDRLVAWPSGSVIRRMYEVNLRWARFVIPQYVIKPTRSTQPCIPSQSLNRVPALIGWGKEGNVTAARWQITQCDQTRHVNYHRGGLVANCYMHLLYLTTAATPASNLYMYVPSHNTNEKEYHLTAHSTRYTWHGWLQF